MMQSTHIIKEGAYGVLDVFGPTLEFLILPEQSDGAYCVMTGTIPPGGSVPLHSHPDIESFFLVSGAVRVVSERDGSFEWLDVRRGEFVWRPEQRKACMAKHVERASRATDNNDPKPRALSPGGRKAHYFGNTFASTHAR